MGPLETARLALTSIALQKVRAVLTMLGIVIGVAAVIAMLSISEGAKLETLQQIRVLGVNNVRVRSVKPVITERKDDEESKENWIFEYGLRFEELRRFQEILPGVEAVVPIRELRKDVWAGDHKTDVSVVGTTSGLADILGYRPQAGRFLTPSDDAALRRVCVLGAEARRKLFRFKPWQGEDVKVGTAWFRVVGVMEDKSAKSSGGISLPNLNNQIYVPYSAAMSAFGATSIQDSAGKFEAVKVEVDEAVLRIRAEEEILPVSRSLRHLLQRAHPKGDFEIVVPLELLRQSQRTQKTFTIVMASIAALSLLVGGIGIMNIMLANVAERKKEIGTRRALGARKRDIRRQFLTESVLLSLIGGLIGVGLGAGGARLIQVAAGWQTVVSPLAVGLAFVVATAAGVIFGTWPAIKAASVDPIVALREE